MGLSCFQLYVALRSEFAKEVMAKIVHYRNKCIGCNSCVEHAPNRWSISKEDGKSDLKDAIQKKDVFIVEIGPDEIKENKKAAEDCPVNIIKILS